MYTCRPTLRTLNLLLHSFILWVTQRALKRERAYGANSLIYMIVLPESCRATNSSGGTRMKGESEKLGKLISRGTWWKNRQSAAAITFIARKPPFVSSPEILLDGAVDQVWVEITGRCPRKDFQKTTRIDVEGKAMMETGTKGIPLENWWR